MDAMKNEKLEAFDRSIDVHISRIRAAIEDDPKKPRRDHHRARRAATCSPRRRTDAPHAPPVPQNLSHHHREPACSWCWWRARCGAAGAGGPPGATGVRDCRRDREPRAAARRRAASRAAAGDRASWRRRFRSDLALYDADGDPIARGRPAAAAAAARRRRRLDSQPRRAGLGVPAAGRTLARGARALRGIAIRRSASCWRWAASRSSSRSAAYPFVRGLTRRLERLQAGVEKLGAGNLSARVEVEGKDEVARLAASFNRSAARIEELVGAHRMLLANASHELRTPLSRIRLASICSSRRSDPEIQGRHRTRHRRARSADRRDPAGEPARRDQDAAARGNVDLLALAAEEGARYDDCAVEGEAVTVRGDRRLLAPHDPQPARQRAAARRAADRGDGSPRGRTRDRRGDATAARACPEAERERVFTPFHRLAGDTEGAGLGLALVRQIARLHGGDAAVTPRPGRPSCFQVSLPNLAATAA